MIVGACVRSGLCCKKSACGYGEWDSEKKQCAFLGVDNDGLALCLKYDEISKDPNSYYSPAFGQGCCMSLGNQDRNEIIAKHYGGVIPTVKIEGY